MRVIKDHCLIEDDWQLLPEVVTPHSLPEAKLIIPYPSWLEHRALLLQRNMTLGVCVDSDADIEKVAEDLACFSLVAVYFPVFSDGRSYSHARLLRERFGFQGDIRAVGDILCDQLFFMKRCGISSFCLREDQDTAKALQALDSFSVFYQGAADGTLPLYRKKDVARS